MKDVLGNHLKDLLFHLVHWLSITLSLRRISQESINLERRSHLECSSNTLSTRGEFGRMTYWSQTLRSWRRWTHRKCTRKDSMRKRWYFPKQGEFVFPIADGRIKTPWRRSRPENIHLGTASTNSRRESHWFSWRIRRSLPQPHDSFPDAGEAINDFWSMSGSFIYRHHVEPRVKLYSPRDESFPFPL